MMSWETRQRAAFRGEMSDTLRGAGACGAFIGARACMLRPGHGGPHGWHLNSCVETYENMTNVRNDVWWSFPVCGAKPRSTPKRTILGRVNFAPRVGPLRNCHG